MISTANPALLSSSSPPPEEFIASYGDIVATLKGYLAAAEEGKLHVSEKVKAFWTARLTFHEGLLQVLEPIGNEELKKQYLEKANQVWQVGLKEVLEKVNKELVGPYALGLSHFQLFSSSAHLFCHAYHFSHYLSPFPDPTGPSEIDTNPNLATRVSFDE